MTSETDRKEAEKLWAHSKYEVLSRSQTHYQKIRELLKTDAPCLMEVQVLIAEACALEEDSGQVENALLHIWGYFKKEAGPEEKADFFRELRAYRAGKVSKEEPLEILRRLLERYPDPYLAQSSIFFKDGGESNAPLA